MHYALSHRDDSAYWKDISKKSYINLMPAVNRMQTQGLYYQTLYQKNFVKFFQDDPGINCLAAGMNWNANDLTTLKNIFPVGVDIKDEFSLIFKNLKNRQDKWKESVETAPSLYQYLKDTFYKD
jgi:hypothetical protein